ncbi:hypothetical protein [Spirulina sp. CCNP1310]|uniref:hypothetical protein n=1 Tax=Spirulina sp. CCNP1310 TaxID=3110249 RepID=UPI002B21D892|nr:hypothetical protein [Spirulina sp. CCNP1310]
MSNKPIAHQLYLVFCWHRSSWYWRWNGNDNDPLADILLDQETIDGEQFREIVAAYIQLPPKQQKLMVAQLS